MQLSPGAQTRVLVPAHEMVRVVNPRGSINPGDINLWVSNGTGVYRLHRAAMSEGGHSLVASPDLSHPSVVIVQRPRRAACAQEVAVFVSRMQRATTPLTRFASAISTCQSVRLVRPQDEQVEEYHAVSVGASYTLNEHVRGPLIIETRLQYPTNEKRRQQSYQVLLTYDGQPGQVLDFETVPETRARYTIRKRHAVVGRQQREYLGIPQDVKRVELSSTADLLVRLVPCSRCECRSAQLPDASCGEMCSYRSQQWPHPQSLWDLSDHELSRSLIDGGLDSVSASALRRIARDNTYRAGGLSSWILARAQAARLPGMRKWRELATDLEGMHTSYRHLLPTAKGADQSQFFAWFYARRAKRLDRAANEYVVAQQHVDDALDHYLSRGHFSSLPASSETPLLFTLPHEDRPSVLRVAFDRRRHQQPAAVLVQFDDGEPIVLRVHGDPDLPTNLYEASLGEVGLAGLHRLHKQADVGTVGGPFSQQRTPAVCFAAGTIRLLVPRQTRFVRIWSAEETRLAVAVLYRKSNVFQLSERAYLELAQREGVASQSFWERMTSPWIEPDASFASRELYNHWQPLMRLLRGHERTLVGSVEDRESPRIEQLPAPETAQWIESARQLSAQQSWLAACEQWSRVEAHGTDHQRREAVAGLLRALVELGEHNLAERTARGLFLHDADVEVQQTARRHLYQQYSKQQDWESLEVLTATAALRHSDPERAFELAHALFANSRFEFALLVATSLPEGLRPRELVVRCAYQLRWWNLFQSEVDKLPSAPQRKYWKAHWLAHQGRYTQSLAMFRSAGPPGHAFAEQMEAGQRILAGLRSADVATRCRAALEWETWWERFPGARLWQSDESLVRSSRGAALLYSVHRDLITRYHQSSKDDPLMLVVHGPANVRITARPRHDTNDNRPIDDWLSVRSTGQHHTFPITANRPSPSLRIVGDQRHVPGKAVHAHVRLGRGRHEVFVHADRSELLVQASVERPELPLPILPSINSDTLETALAGQWNPRLDPDLAAPVAATHVLGARGEVTGQPFVRGPSLAAWNPDTMLADLPATLAARIALRSAADLDFHQSAVGQLAESDLQLDPHERLLALTQSSPVHRADALLLHGRHLLPSAMRLAYLTATGRHPRLEELGAKAETSADLIRRMALMARESEHNSHLRDRMVMLGRQLRLMHPKHPELQSLAARLTSSLRWQLRNQYDRSAGIFIEDITTWTPESPRLRVRRAMTRNLSEQDHVLIGDDALVLTSSDSRPTRLEIVLEPLAVGYDPQHAATVQYEVDGRQAGSVQVTPKFVSRLSIELDSGKHSVRWRMVDPALGQMVRLAVQTQGPDTTATEILAPTGRRQYQVATHLSPVEFTVKGPTILRIDEKRAGVTNSRFVHVSEASRRITLSPPEGAKRAVFRVFEASHEAGRRRRHPVQVAVVPQPVLPPLVGSIDLPTQSDGFGDIQLASLQTPDDVNWLPLTPPDVGPVAVDDLDQRVLGAQEDGTWDLGLGWFSRQAIEESPAESNVDQFVEFHAIHRLASHPYDTCWRNEVLLRTRESSGPTIGLKHQGWTSPTPVWTARWTATAYTQRPIPLMPSVNRDQEWAVDGRLRLSRRYEIGPRLQHTLSLTTFARELTLDMNRYGGGQVDQDVFTDYKTDHPAGLLLTDRLVWEPCEGRRWWLSPMVATNEDFNPGSPDHYGARAGIQQAIGRLDFDIAYRYTQFVDDRDRRRAVDQHLLLFDAHLHRWNLFGRRTELSTRIRYDVEDGRTIGNIVLSWYFDRGRQYRDFHASEMRFLGLRRRRAELETTPWLLE